MSVILAVAVPEWHGVRRAMRAITPRVESPETALAAMEADPPLVVVFGCYQPAWEPILSAAKSMGCKTVFTWYASYILNEFDRRNRDWMCAGLHFAREGRFDFVATPHWGLARAWNHYGIPTDVLPPTIDTSLMPVPKRQGVHLGIFGSAMPWKNMDCQLVGAGMITAAQIHVQARRRQLNELYGLTVHVHPFVTDDDEYRALVGSMRVNLCVSLSETYSYLSAESLLMATPVITSSLAPIYHGAPDILSGCRVEAYDDPCAIARAIDWVMARYDDVASAGRSHLLHLDAHNRRAADVVIGKWLSAAMGNRILVTPSWG